MKKLVLMLVLFMGIGFSQNSLHAQFTVKYDRPTLEKTILDIERISSYYDPAMQEQNQKEVDERIDRRYAGNANSSGDEMRKEEISELSIDQLKDRLKNAQNLVDKLTEEKHMNSATQKAQKKRIQLAKDIIRMISE